MDVLVTGGAGFIGSNLVRRLLGQGHAVRVLDNLATGSLANLEGVDVEFIKGTVVELADVRQAAEGVEVVFHQAALPSVPRSVADPVASYEVNATGTLQLLVAARDAGVRRVVNAASSSAYGDTTQLPKSEDMVPQPISPYAVSKLAGEHLCKAFSATYQMETVSLRYFNVYGPYQNPEGGYAAVIPKLISNLLSGAAPVIHGDGTQTRDFTFVHNVVDANLLAATSPHVGAGEVFNVACGQQTSINQLFERLRRIVGVKLEPQYGPARKSDVRDSWADIQRAAESLGYEPAVGLAEGLEITVEWYRSHGG